MITKNFNISDKLKKADDGQGGNSTARRKKIKKLSPAGRFSPGARVCLAAALLIALLVGPAPRAEADSTTLSPGTVDWVWDEATCGISLNKEWKTTENAKASNNFYAEFTDKNFDANVISSRLDLTNFAFAVPDGATIDGVKVEIERHAEKGGAQDEVVHLMLAGSPDTTQNKALASTAWPASPTDTYQSYGGVTDKWGIGTLSESDVEDSGFGATLCVEATAKDTDAFVDHVQITVYYTPTTPLTDVSNSPSPNTVSDSSTHTVAFTTVDALPADGKILVTFPAGFDLSAVGSEDISGTMDGSFTVSTSGQELTITRSGGTEQPAGAENIIIADITNTGTAGAAYTVDVETRDSGSSTINGPTTSSSFTIKGKSALANPAIQVTDQLGSTSGTQPSDVELVGFKITPTGENLTWTDLVISLNYGGGMADADITSARIYVDNGTVGTYESGTDTQVGAQSVNASGGSLTWDTVGGTITAATNYLIIFDAGDTLSANETVQASVTAANITVTGATSSASITTSGVVTGEPLHTVTIPPASAALSGTITATVVESDIVAGGETIIIDLTGDTWVAAGATFDAVRQNIIDGLDSAQSESTGWNAEVRDKQGVAGVVRTTDTRVTITLDAQAGYSINADETITVTVPATAVTGSVAIVATPTFDINDLCPFSYRRPITIDHTKVGVDNLGALPVTGFPVLVSLTGDWLKTTAEDPANGRIQSAAGDDIIFRAADGRTHLYHEIEYYDGSDATGGELVAWVRIDSLSKQTDTIIYMYYGNECVDSATQYSGNVWDANYQVVMHLSDNVTDEEATGTHLDSTSYGNNGTQGNNGTTAGKIANAQSFDGDDIITIGDVDALDGISNMTVSAWVEFSVLDPWGVVVGKGVNSSTDKWAMEQGLSGDNLRVAVRDGQNQGWDTGSILATDGQAHLWTMVYDGTLDNDLRLKFYLDGAEQTLIKWKGGTVAPATQENAGLLTIGKSDYGTEGVEGIIDEVRVGTVSRSADWIVTEFNNQIWPDKAVTPSPDPSPNPDSGFFTLGTEEVAGVTAVDLISFTATGDDGAVQVSWETARENHHLGFHVYRSPSATGTFVRLTDDMIAGTGFSAELKQYRFVDGTVSPGRLYYYLLEDVDVSGQRTDHGPICVDWDADGLPDDWEIAHGLNPNLNDADLDYDNDGLSNLEEYERGTDPFNPDSDGDGITDGIDDGRIDRDGPGELRSLDRGVYVVASDENGVTLELRTEFFDSTVIRMGDQEFDRLHIADYVHGTTDAIGSPEMPLKGILVDIPAGRSASLAIVATEVETHTGYRVYPVPENVADEQDEAARVSEVFVIDEEAYEQNGFYPNTAARLGQSYVFRDQSQQQVIFYPLAFNAATGQMILYTRIRVRINYGDQPLARADDAQPVPWKLPAAGPSNGISAFGLMAAVSGTTPVLSSFIFSPILSIGLINAALWSPPGDSPPAVPAHKILLTEEGIYRLTCAELSGSGVAVAGSDLSNIRLYHLGREVALDVVDANGTVCDGSDYIQFYAPAVSDQYTKYAKNNVFWLTTGSAAGAPLRMADIESTPPPAGAAAAVTHAYTVHAEDDQDYWKDIPGADSLDRWFSYNYVSATEENPVGTAAAFPLSLPGAAGSGSLKVLMVSTNDKDHEVDVEVVAGGVTLAVQNFTWNGLDFFEAVIDNVAFDPNNSAHSVNITCNSGEDFILVDWIEATYPQNFTADNDALKFTHETGYTFGVSGFGSNNLQAFDISDAADVGRVITTAPVGNALAFEPPAGSGQARTYLVVDTDEIKTLADVQIEEDAHSTLFDTTNAADYILITHAAIGWDGNGDAYDWLTDLTALRQAQGLRVKVVDVTDIFDEFSYGLQTPEAIRDFLAYAYDNWSAPAPQYVLLVGDGSFDPKGNYSWHAADTTVYLPTYLAFTDYQGETPTDEYFVRISGGDAVPDLYIGRLPAVDAAGAAVMVNKILDYETAVNTKSWEKSVLLVADNQDPGEEHAYEVVFKEMNDDAAALLPAEMEPATGYLGVDFATGGALKNYIINKLNDDPGLVSEQGGALIVNYSGHSSMQRWATENIFENADVASLDNGGMLPFIISMSCLAGNFSWPESFVYPSLGEALMRSEGQNKGAVAALVPTGQTTTGGQRILNTALFDTIFTKDVRQLGPAIAEAKRTLLANGDAYFEQVSETFLLFGDPAMALKVPLPRRPSGLAAEGRTDAIALQWQASADGDGNAVAGYNLYRSQSPGGPYIKVNTGLINTTSYEDSAQQLPAVGTTYYYMISSVDADGDQSVRSEMVSAALVVPALDAAAAVDVIGGGGGGGGGGCFILTVSEPGAAGYPWMLVVFAVIAGIGVLNKGIRYKV